VVADDREQVDEPARDLAQRGAPRRHRRGEVLVVLQAAARPDHLAAHLHPTSCTCEPRLAASKNAIARPVDLVVFSPARS
jgi:hypothetical protein